MGELLKQRWQVLSPDRDCIAELQASLVEVVPDCTNFHPLLARILANRGVDSSAEFINPSCVDLPDPGDDFPQLAIAVELLASAIRDGQEIAICGDYDADGMTSTALLLRTFRHLGGSTRYDIPSRMTEGYGINERMVRQLHAEGVAAIVTVDNGIAALKPIALARDLGLKIIVTDHHDIPPQLPPAEAILNPKLIARSESPYAGMAGVGVAYLLALELAERFGERQRLARPLLELLTLGTIADLAPLTEINRRWVKQGLALLPQSQITGIQALMQVTGLSERRETLQPEAIGFGLGPRINAVGRLAQPSVVIELLTTDDEGIALEKAMECEQLNQQRRQLCSDIEAAALAQIEQLGIDPKRDRVLVLLGEGWHHGVIGIVASRLLERYCVPVFIGAREGDNVRGSARGISGFNVFEALQHCHDLFEKYGGHPAAGGFSMPASNWTELQEGLQDYAHSVLEPDDLCPLVEIDAELVPGDINAELFDCLQLLQPYGIGNREPIFAMRNLEVANQRQIGKERAHLKLQVRSQQGGTPKTAIAWRAGDSYPLPNTVDIAFALRQNQWQGEVAIELEVKGIRASKPQVSATPAGRSQPSKKQPVLHYVPAPDIPYPLWWKECSTPINLLPSSEADNLGFSGTILLYGYSHPQPMSNDRCTVHCDRPLPEVPYDRIVLWTMPPSRTHLSWLLARSTPASPLGHRITLCAQPVPVLTPQELQQRLQEKLSHDSTIHLLKAAQEWWVAPSTLVAGLRSLGYPCEQFPATRPLEKELENLSCWYRSSAKSLESLFAPSKTAPLPR
ncbi:MAG: single-stranded-DNA-specific exonuclease RecJ [Synechococcus sp.]